MSNEESKVFKLQSPLKLGDTPLNEITLREPKALEIEMAEKLSGGGINSLALQLIAIVSGQNINTIRQLGARDYIALRGYLSSFLDDSQGTGSST